MWTLSMLLTELYYIIGLISYNLTGIYTMVETQTTMERRNVKVPSRDVSCAESARGSWCKSALGEYIKYRHTSGTNKTYNLMYNYRNYDMFANSFSFYL